MKRTTDWQRIAQKRLKELRDADAKLEYLRCDIYNHIRRELGIALHARCIGDSENIAIRVANEISMRLTQK